MTVIPSKHAWNGQGKKQVLLRGMHGLGDNLHQRGPLKHWVARGTHEFWLETSWPSIYHDMPEIKCVATPIALRAQTKNVAKEERLFTREKIPQVHETWVIWYRKEDIAETGGVVQALARNLRVPQGIDFRLPVPESWRQKATALIAKWNIKKPIMFYRPLIERTEWNGCQARNPQFEAYYQVFQAIRDRFFVVSIADLVPNIEWIAGFKVKADHDLHRSELDFETLTGLCEQSALVYGSPGMAVVLGQAVGTPVICVFGGFERCTSFSAGARFTPTLTISPIHPVCGCWRSDCRCDKTISIDQAIVDATKFVDQYVPAERISSVA